MKITYFKYELLVFMKNFVHFQIFQYIETKRKDFMIFNLQNSLHLYLSNFEEFRKNFNFKCMKKILPIYT